MTKYLKPLSAVCAVSILLVGCGHNDNSDPGTIKDSQHHQKKDKKQDSSKKQEGETKTKDKKKKSHKKQKQKLTLNQAIKSADKLHDFIVEDADFYDNMKKDYKNEGIQLKGIGPMPYLYDARPKDQDQMLVFAGIIDHKDVAKKSKNEAIITYKVKSGLSSAYTNHGTYVDPAEVGKDIQQELKTNDKYKNKISTVKYKVTMNKDHKATIEKLTKGDWSENNS